MKLLIIGGVAGGASAAARSRRGGFKTFKLFQPSVH